MSFGQNVFKGFHHARRRDGANDEVDADRLEFRASRFVFPLMIVLLLSGIASFAFAANANSGIMMGSECEPA